MENSSAAFYIPKYGLKSIVKNKNLVKNIKNTISYTLSKANLKIANFNVSNFASNLCNITTSPINISQSIAALTSIVNGNPVKNEALLDIFLTPSY